MTQVTAAARENPHPFASFDQDLGQSSPQKTTRAGNQARHDLTFAGHFPSAPHALLASLARDLKLLLLDEPYEGLAPVIVHEIERILQEVKQAGITTIIVEQNAIAALKLADSAIILDTGEIVFRGSAQEVLDNEDLRHEYLAI